MEVVEPERSVGVQPSIVGQFRCLASIGEWRRADGFGRRRTAGAATQAALSPTNSDIHESTATTLSFSRTHYR